MSGLERSERSDEPSGERLPLRSKGGQARSFQSAALGSLVSENTLGSVSDLPENAMEKPSARNSSARIKSIWRDALERLRDHLRAVRKKRRAKCVDRIRQALDLSGFKEEQFESAKRLSSIDGSIADLVAKIEVVQRRVEALVNHNLIYLGDAYVALRTPYGYVICPQAEYHLIIYLSEGGTHEPGTCRVVESLIEAGDHVIDVGAQVGLLTLAMGRAVGASGTVLAIEASQALAECLRRTLSINGLNENCQIVEMAVSDRVGQATFHLAERSGHSSLIALSEKSQEVQIQTAPLDEIVESGKKISLIKVDVEGAELLVLQGMKRILEENPEIILVVEFGPSHLYRVGQSVEQWLDAFKKCGFDQILEIDEASAACRPLRSESELAKIQSLNLVFARSGTEKIKRMRVV